MGRGVSAARATVIGARIKQTAPSAAAAPATFFLIVLSLLQRALRAAVTLPHVSVSQHSVRSAFLADMFGNWFWCAHMYFCQSTRTLLSQKSGPPGGPDLLLGWSSTNLPLRTWTIKSAV